VGKQDKVFGLIKEEEKRQVETLMLIPSENYASRAVREALGSILNNKYAEGYPGKRYYQGNRIIDEIEQIAVDRAKMLFGVPYANVQPYSGSPANAAVLMALVAPGEKMMGMKLSAGGHLTHGHNVTFSGKFYSPVQYDVDEKGLINYDEVIGLAKTEKPKLIFAGTTAYPRILDWKLFREAADAAGAYLVADISHIAGLVVVGEHPSPVPFADVIMTTTHKTLRGPRGAMLLVTDRGRDRDRELEKKIDKAVFPGIQGGPHEATVAAIAVALEEAGQPEYKTHIKQVVKNAKTLAEELIIMKYELSTGGTDNHLMVIDLRGKGISGKEAAIKLEEAGIVTNYNAIPHDTNPPANPSGIRLGTPAVTTRGMKENEMKQVADFINQIINTKSEETRKQVEDLCRKFPVPD
jgi:glycine hydroxymethyltransferase